MAEEEKVNENPSVRPSLLENTKAREKKYWQHIYFVKPRFPAPSSGYKNSDFDQIYCTKCEMTMKFKSGSSQSVRYHMHKHYGDLTRVY